MSKIITYIDITYFSAFLKEPFSDKNLLSQPLSYDHNQNINTNI